LKEIAYDLWLNQQKKVRFVMVGIWNAIFMYDLGIDFATCFCGVLWNGAKNIRRAAHSGCRL